MVTYRKEEAIERATNGEDGDSHKHTDSVGSLVVVKAERLLTSLSLLALEVGLSIRNGGGALVHLLADLLHETLPELLFLLTTLANLAN